MACAIFALSFSVSLSKNIVQWNENTQLANIIEINWPFPIIFQKTLKEGEYYQINSCDTK